MFRRLTNRFAGKFLSIVAAIGGMLGSLGCPAYGVFIPPPPYDPDLMLEDLSYTPQATFDWKPTIVFQVTANKPSNAGYAAVSIDEPFRTVVRLKDDGAYPDLVADDGIWSGRWQIPDIPVDGEVPVTALFIWHTTHKPVELEGEPFVFRGPGSYE